MELKEAGFPFTMGRCYSEGADGQDHGREAQTNQVSKWKTEFLTTRINTIQNNTTHDSKNNKIWGT